jgi:succinate dehydrogenase / fumarate reductase, iron-sulfur subunit
MKLSIFRFNPERDAKLYMQDYDVKIGPADVMLLDLIMRVRMQDDSLALRKSCREGVCGSDAMNINGRNGLACITPIRTLREPVVLRPLPAFPVIRDLVVDMSEFFKQYRSIRPYIVDDEPMPEKERLQSPEDREKLDGLYEYDVYRLFRCRTIMNCTEVCPKFLAPSRAIEKIRLLLAKESL